MPTLKAEFRKLLTVRSTYLVTMAIIALSCLFTYIGTSALDVSGPPPSQNASTQQKSTEVSAKPPLKTKNLHADQLESNILSTTGAAIFIAVVVVLLMAHEFRYNTITYTLTSSNSRSRVLASKAIVGVSYALAATALAVAITVAVTYLAVNIKGLNLPAQDINWLYINARLFGYILGYSMVGLAIVTLVRNLTASIVALFLLPTLDSLAGLLLNRNHTDPAKYLPFSALNRIGMDSSGGGTAAGSAISISRAIIVFSAYLLTLWAITWYLFLRRDAT